MVIVGTHKKGLDSLTIGPVHGVYAFHLSGLDQNVRRMPPVVESPTLETAVFTLNWITTPRSYFGPVCNHSCDTRIEANLRKQFATVVWRTTRQMMVPIPTILMMLGLGSITRFGGMDATLGMAFKNTGVLYPFFGALLGWIGVFLTGTDAGSNALFGSLQRITALQIGLNQTLICTANSTGGVMGKMIDAQSICVATAATDQVGKEADIFKVVVRHSIALAAIVGLIVLLQAYVYPFTLMVPH